MEAKLIFDLYIEGDGNVQELFVQGSQNTFENIFIGNGNYLTISKDDSTDDPSVISQQQLKNYVTGNGNILDFYLNDNIAAVSDIAIIGNGNQINFNSRRRKF